MDKFGREEYDKHNAGMEPGKEVDVYVIRRPDKQIWPEVMPGEYSPRLVVTEAAAIPQQATALPAAE